jgi:hypothetical protein
MKDRMEEVDVERSGRYVKEGSSIADAVLCPCSVPLLFASGNEELVIKMLLYGCYRPTGQHSFCHFAVVFPPR